PRRRNVKASSILSGFIERGGVRAWFDACHCDGSSKPHTIQPPRRRRSCLDCGAVSARDYRNDRNAETLDWSNLALYWRVVRIRRGGRVESRTVLRYGALMMFAAAFVHLASVRAGWKVLLAPIWMLAGVGGLSTAFFVLDEPRNTEYMHVTHAPIVVSGY